MKNTKCKCCPSCLATRAVLVPDLGENYRVFCPKHDLNDARYTDGRPLLDDQCPLCIIESLKSKQPIEVKVFQHDWIPGFAAFLDDGSVDEKAEAHVALNIGSVLCAVATGDMEKKDVPYIVADSVMHEIVHALEAWAHVEFSEERVEALIDKYRSSLQGKRETA